MDLGSGIRKKPIPDPGSRGQKGTGSRIRIRNTGYRYWLAFLLLLSSSAYAGFPYHCLRPFVATFPIILSSSAVARFPYCLRHFVATFPTVLSSSTNAGFPYCCLRPFVATFSTVAVVRCKCWLPLHLFVSHCCYLLYCCCRPLQFLASHSVCVPYSCCVMLVQIFFQVNRFTYLSYRVAVQFRYYACPELEFLNNLWGLGTEKE
jgi:hypothetical protein